MDMKTINLWLAKDMDGNWFFIEPIMVFLPRPPVSLETRPCQMIHGAASPKRMEEKARSSREKAIISTSHKSIVVECFVSIVANNIAVLQNLIIANFRDEGEEGGCSSRRKRIGGEFHSFP